MSLYTLEQICHGCRHARWHNIGGSAVLHNCAANATEDGADRLTGRCPEREAEPEEEE